MSFVVSLQCRFIDYSSCIVLKRVSFEISGKSYIEIYVLIATQSI